MTSANDCRAFGAECLAWAKAAGSDKERLAFLHMANTWLYAAANLEGRLNSTLQSEQSNATTTARHDETTIGVAALIFLCA